jgi:hypothetical protein
MLPYLVTSSEEGVALLELADGRFQMFEEGKVAAFASGYQYLLVERALAKFLRDRKLPGVRFKPAVIFSRVSRQEHHTHVQVKVAECFNVDEIKVLQLDGNRLLSMNGEHFFVSPSLKQALEDSGFSSVQFSEGLSGFAGAA